MEKREKLFILTRDVLMCRGKYFQAEILKFLTKYFPESVLRFRLRVMWNSFLAFSKPEETFKTLELKGEVPEEAFIRHMISYIDKQ